MKTVVFWSVLVVIGFALGFGVWYAPKVHANPHPAFTVVMSVQTGDGSQTVPDSTYVIASNGNEAMLRDIKLPNGRVDHTRSVTNFEKGVKASLSDTNRSISSVPVMKADRQAKGTCTPNNDVSMMNGYQVFHVSYDFTRPDGSKDRLEKWISPELGCWALKEVATHNGQILTTKFAKSVVSGEPDPSLFDIPSGYTEMAPTDQINEYHREMQDGRECRTCSQVLDQTYENKRKRAQ